MKSVSHRSGRRGETVASVANKRGRPQVLTDMTHSIETAQAAKTGRLGHSRLGDPAVWAWLFVALLALLPARAALHVILA